jgi:DtxR family Mn-dependent transcriptional regulator
VSDLIDTTEMYLRTVYELQEEGIVPMRARIAERLCQSGPTVSQTVARMERDGLLVVSGDRHLEFTPGGLAAATRVMRKHRLAECLLIQILGMPWEEAHAEACRWEHVISDAVERRILGLLDHPTVSPYGNPIPGLGELLPDSEQSGTDGSAILPLTRAVTEEASRVVVRRIAEPIQDDPESMSALRRVGALPGATVIVQRTPAGVSIASGGEAAELSSSVAVHVLVQAPPA